MGHRGTTVGLQDDHRQVIRGLLMGQQKFTKTDIFVNIIADMTLPYLVQSWSQTL